MGERKVLCREVKNLREENIYLKKSKHDSKRQETLLTLERHLFRAMQVHEQQLTSISNENSPSQKLNTVKIESPDDLVSSSSDDDEESEEEEEEPVIVEEEPIQSFFHSIMYASSSMNQISE